MTPRQTRALRGVAAAWTATILAAAAHTLAGGGAPAPVFVGAIAVLTSPIAVALAGRRLSLWRVGLTVLVSQALFHVAFALTANTRSGTVASGHDHAGAQMIAHPSSALPLLPDAPMLLGHAVAAGVTMFALHRGERMLCALGRSIRRLLGLDVDTAGVVTQTAPPPPVTWRGDPSPRRVALSDLSRRGPPAVVVAAG